MSRQLYSYPQKQNVKTSLDITEITPVYWNTLYPGESIKDLNFRNLTRMITPIYPTLDSPYVDLYAFAVPKRIIQQENTSKNPDYLNHSVEFNKEYADWNEKPWDKKYGNISEYFNPYTYSNASDNSGKPSSLLSKFGINKLSTFSGANHMVFLDLLYPLAYKKIYFDFFRQKQLEQTDYNTFYNMLDTRAQQGKQNPGEFPEVSAILKKDKPYITEKMYLQAIWYLDRINVCNVDNDYLNNITFTQVNTGSLMDFNLFKTNLFDKFIHNTKIMSGIDYGTQKDILLKVWNTDNHDKTSAQLIGFERYNQEIKQVINQSKGTTDSQALGEVGGLSVTYNEGNLINEYTATEETVIMVLAVPNYKLVVRNFVQPNSMTFNLYSNNLVNYRTYNPNVDYVQQPVFEDSTFLNEANENNVLFYEKPFNILRQKAPVVAGEVANLWSNWTYSIEYNPKEAGNSLGLDILKARKAPFKETLVSNEQDSFITEWEFSAEFLRTLKPDYLIEQDIIEGN